MEVFGASESSPLNRCLFALFRLKDLGPQAARPTLMLRDKRPLVTTNRRQSKLHLCVAVFGLLDELLPLGSRLRAPVSDGLCLTVPQLNMLTTFITKGFVMLPPVCRNRGLLPEGNH